MIAISRLEKKYLNTNLLHVMVQGVNKEYIFENEKYIKKYLDILEKSKKMLNIEILAHCIMNNHAHFLIYVDNISELGEFMHRSNQTYSQFYNKEKNRVGVLFRNRYRVEPIYNIKYLINCIKYIHENPVKANLVSKSEDYPYSSYKDYKNNVGVTQKQIMIDIFGKECNYRELFQNTFEKRYMDVADSKVDDSKEYIMAGINEFRENTGKTASEILSERKTLRELIIFLNEECNIRFKEVGDFFGIPKNAMNKIKSN